MIDARKSNADFIYVGTEVKKLRENNDALGESAECGWLIKGQAEFL